MPGIQEPVRQGHVIDAFHDDLGSHRRTYGFTWCHRKSSLVEIRWYGS
jgi:hypothetical protein